MHDVANCSRPDCYGCKLATLQITPSSMPSRMHPEHAPKREPDSFARGVARDLNGVPIHRPDGSVIGFRELARNPKAITSEMRDRRNAGKEGTTPEAGRPHVTLSTSGAK